MEIEPFAVALHLPAALAEPLTVAWRAGALLPERVDLASLAASSAPVGVTTSALIEEAVTATAGALPLVVLDGPADAAGRAALLDAGAADVLAAPADPDELAARLRAIVRLRRMPPIACADLSVDLLARRATRAGRPLPLHPREFALLGALARHRDRPLDRLALLRLVWQQRFDPGTNIVAVNVSRLRAKVDHGFAFPLIHTVPGAGYMLSHRAVAMS